MPTPTSLHGPRAIAVVPPFAAYRLQPGRLVTFAGVVRPEAVARPAAPAPAPESARKAA